MCDQINCACKKHACKWSEIFSTNQICIKTIIVSNKYLPHNLDVYAHFQSMPEILFTNSEQPLFKGKQLKPFFLVLEELSELLVSAVPLVVVETVSRPGISLSRPAKDGAFGS